MGPWLPPLVEPGQDSGAFAARRRPARHLCRLSRRPARGIRPAGAVLDRHYGRCARAGLHERLRLPRRRSLRLVAFGRWMQRNRRWCSACSGSRCLPTCSRVAVPAFLPLPDTRHMSGMTHPLCPVRLCWGIWWPFVLVSMMLIGRRPVRCVVLRGFVTEQVSRFTSRPVPRWISGVAGPSWPFWAPRCMASW